MKLYVLMYRRSDIILLHTRIMSVNTRKEDSKMEDRNDKRLDAIIVGVVVVLLLCLVLDIILEFVFMAKLVTLPAPWNIIMPICQTTIIVLSWAVMYDMLGLKFDWDEDDES